MPYFEALDIGQLRPEAFRDGGLLPVEHLDVLTIDSLRNPDSDPKLRAFTNDMAGLPRYDGINMLHRTNLRTHTMRVRTLAQFLGRRIEKLETNGLFFDFQPYWMIFALMQHDSPELGTGDLPATIKQKFSHWQHQQLEKAEDQATVDNCIKYFRVRCYRDLDYFLKVQKILRQKKSPEAKVINFADKLDPIGEKLHEVACGNDQFIELLQNSRQVLAGFENYEFWTFIKSHPQLQLDQIPSDDDLLRLPKITFEDTQDPDQRNIFAKTKEWPAWYQTWLQKSYQTFHKAPNQFIYPGWYPDIDKKLVPYVPRHNFDLEEHSPGEWTSQELLVEIMREDYLGDLTQAA